MLRATIEAGMAMRVIDPAELKRINVDTTVETKAIRFPTDARLYERMRERLFRGRHFDREVIVLCVRWYLRYKLSSRDLVELMSERGLYLAHTMIVRWVQRYVPEFIERWNRFGLLVTPGESRRPLSKCAANGHTSIERKTSVDRRSISCSAGHAMYRLPRTSSRRQSGMRGSRHIQSPSTAMRLRIALFARCVRTVCCPSERSYALQNI